MSKPLCRHKLAPLAGGGYNYRGYNLVPKTIGGAQLWVVLAEDGDSVWASAPSVAKLCEEIDKTELLTSQE